MVRHDPRYIDSIAYFEGITPAERLYLMDNALRRHYTVNDVIFQEGGKVEGLWIVEHGPVKIFKLSPQGHEHILYLCGPDTTFNDIGALDGGNNPANASALSAEVQF
ncbi:MAG: Crp/Fnr family transcriptional regulator [Chloroflexota bacterium]